MGVVLKHQGWLVNRKHVQRLMRMLELAGMAPGPGTTVQHPGHKGYPSLLRGVPLIKRKAAMKSAALVQYLKR
jgi:putative transposase